MKSKLFILLLTIGAGSNISAMFSPESWKKAAHNQRTYDNNTPTQFIFANLIRSQKNGMYKIYQCQKDLADASYRGVISTIRRDYSVALFDFETFRNKGDDVRINTKIRGLGYEESQHYGFGPALDKLNKIISVDGQTQCAYTEEPGEFNCTTKLTFNQFVDEFNKAKMLNPQS